MVSWLSDLVVGHSRLELNSTIGKSWMVGLVGNYSYAKFPKVAEHTSGGTGSGGSYSNSWASIPTIRDLSAGVRFYYFKRKEGKCAPSGRYLVAGLDFGIKNSLTETVVETTIPQYPYNETYTYYSSTKETVERSVILSMGFGRSFVLKKRILFGYGLDFGLDLFASDTDQFAIRHLLKPLLKIGYTF